MGVDEADLPARQPERSIATTTTTTTTTTPSNNTGGGLLETPRPPVVAPGAVHVNNNANTANTANNSSMGNSQQPPALLLTLNNKGSSKEKKKKKKDADNEDEWTTLGNISNNNSNNNNNNNNSVLLDCAPSRQPSTKTLADQQGTIHTSGTTTIQTTSSNNTNTTTPGVVAVSGLGMESSSNNNNNNNDNNNAANTNNITSMTSNTTGETDDSYPPTTIITATKVVEEDEVDYYHHYDHRDRDEERQVDEAVRLAQEEAERLRQQVRSLQQQEQQRGQAAVSSSQVLVVATAANDDKDATFSPDDDDEESTGQSKTKKCRWIGGLVLFLGIAIGGGIAIFLTLQKDANTTTSLAQQAATMSPTMSPTLPCLNTITPPDKNYTNRIKPILQTCQGDCDYDTDCDEGLECFHRNRPFDPVPGCSCWEEDATRNDYCIPIPTDPCLVETNDYPLGMCEGKCKGDTDCQKGLVCRAFFPGQYISGCQHCEKEEEGGGEADEELTGGFFPGFVPSNETDMYNGTGNNDYNTTGNNGNNGNNETEFTTGKLPEIPTDFNLTNNGFLPNNNNNTTEDESTSSIGNNETGESPSRLPDNYYTFSGGRKLQVLWNEEVEEERENKEEGPTPAPTAWIGTVDDQDWTKEPTPAPTVWKGTVDEKGNTQPPKDEENNDDYNDDNSVMLTRGPTSAWATRPPVPNNDLVEDFVMYCVPGPEDDFENILNDPGGTGDFTGSKVDGEGDGLLSESGAGRILGSTRVPGILLAAAATVLSVILAW
ncbi:unnamed protein product [Cylindrotheca closterium]|uniref:Uncharacterized protein n=1 Tax=Cylindrotheca closterium TaxID=2856 RepID=A0AAD2PXX1_9STRA|nr:unnamed protein product [Cylindrotheca closterium]